MINKHRIRIDRPASLEQVHGPGSSQSPALRTMPLLGKANLSQKTNAPVLMFLPMAAEGSTVTSTADLGRQVLTGWNILSFFLPLGFAAFSILPLIPWSSLDFCSTVPILVQSVPSASAGLDLESCVPVVSELGSSCTCRMVQFGQM